MFLFRKNGELLLATFFLILLFFLPTQLGRHFWPEFSVVNGIRVDYLSPTIYLTDILITTILLIDVFKNRNILLNTNKVGGFFKKTLVVSFLVFVFFTLNIVFATTPLVALIKSLKILEVAYVGFLTSRMFKNTVVAKKSIIVIVFSLFVQSLLVLWQSVFHSSAGGFWWFLGERAFNSSTPFISQAIINGQLILRPYGTFSHPNILGGFSVFCLGLFVIFYCLIRKNNNLTGLYKKVIFIGIFISVLLSFISLSRVAMALSFVWLTYLLFLVKNKALFWLFGLLTIVLLVANLISPITYRMLSLFDQDQKSYLIREQLLRSSVVMLGQSPIIGVGLNNYLIQKQAQFLFRGDLVRQIQPVHNIFLLFIVESGVVGAALLTLLIYKLILTVAKEEDVQLKNTKLLLLLSLIVVGVSDHYLYTQQQTLLLLGVVLGIVSSKETKKIHAKTRHKN